MTIFAVFFAVLVANYEFAGFAPKTKIHGLDRFHGNGPYCKIPTEKEPIRALGFAQNGFAVLLYIKEATEPLTRILNNNGIRATTRPVKTLQQEFASPKSRPPSDRQTNVVYKIPCADCTWNYIGETGRCLHTRKKEHTRNTKVLT